MTTRLSKQKMLRAYEWDLLAVDVGTAPIESGWVDVSGFDQLTLFLNWQVPAGGATTELRFNVEATFNDIPGSGAMVLPPFLLQIQEAPANSAGGFVDVVFDNMTFVKERDGLAEHQWMINIPINYHFLRLVNVFSDNGNPGDLLTVNAFKSYLG